MMIMRKARSQTAMGVLGLTLASCLTTLACATAQPGGPAFREASAPTAFESLVYLYRDDRARPLGRPTLRLSGLDLEEIHDGEYHPLYLRPGQHRLDMRLVTGGLLPTSWHSVTFCALPGTTSALRIWSAYEVVDAIESPAMQRTAPGRDDIRANMALLAAAESFKDAKRNLEQSRLANWMRAALVGQVQPAAPAGMQGEPCENIIRR